MQMCLLMDDRRQKMTNGEIQYFFSQILIFFFFLNSYYGYNQGPIVNKIALVEILSSKQGDKSLSQPMLRKIK